MKLPGLSVLEHVACGVARQTLATALGLDGSLHRTLSQVKSEQHPLLFFVRGTGASAQVFDPFHLALFKEIELVHEIKVVDVRLKGNGLGSRAADIDYALDFIERRHVKEPDRPVFVGGQSFGAEVACEAAIRFSWVIGVIAFVPPAQGSHLSHPRIPTALGTYGFAHATMVETCARRRTWIDSGTAVPVLDIWCKLDGLIWPPTAACIEGAENVALSWWWNHFTAPFAPTAVKAVYHFLSQVLAAHYDAITEPQRLPLAPFDQQYQAAA